MLKIYELELGEKGVIRSVNCDAEIKERLESFGVVPGLEFTIEQKYEDNNLVIGWDKARIAVIEMFGKDIIIDKINDITLSPTDKRLTVIRAMDTIINNLNDNEPKEDWHMFIVENTKVTNEGSSTLSNNKAVYEEACKLFANLISAYGKNGFKNFEE